MIFLLISNEVYLFIIRYFSYFYGIRDPRVPVHQLNLHLQLHLNTIAEQTDAKHKSQASQKQFPLKIKRFLA